MGSIEYRWPIVPLVPRSHHKEVTRPRVPTWIWTVSIQVAPGHWAPRRWYTPEKAFEYASLGANSTGRAAMVWHPESDLVRSTRILPAPR